MAGAWLVTLTSPEFLRRILPVVLFAVFIYTLARKDMGREHRPRFDGRAEMLATCSIGLTIGFYDGFFGPGVGSFWTIAFVMVLGHNFVKAAAHAKVMNLTSNAASLALFAASGAVLVGPGLALGAGQLLGGRLGAHLALTRGARFVRPIFLVMASLTIAKLVHRFYFAS